MAPRLNSATVLEYHLRFYHSPCDNNNNSSNRRATSHQSLGGAKNNKIALNNNNNIENRKLSDQFQELLMQKPSHDDSAILKFLQEKQPECMMVPVQMTLCGEKCTVTALHLAVAMNCSVDVLRAMHQIDPKAIQTPEPRGGRYPIHLALQMMVPGGGGFEQIKFLLQQWPECCLHAVDHMGQLPIHIAAQYATDAVLQLVVSTNPTAAHCRTHRQRTALHFVAASRCEWNSSSNTTSTTGVESDSASSLTFSTSTLQAIIDAYPKALELADSQGRLPLHLAACTAFPRFDCLQLLCNAHSPALLVTDYDHKTPLQLHQRFGGGGSSCPLSCYHTTASPHSSLVGPTIATDIPDTTLRSSFSPDNDVITAFLQDRTTMEKRKHRVFYKLFSKVPLKKPSPKQPISGPVVDLMNCYG